MPQEAKTREARIVDVTNGSIGSVPETPLDRRQADAFSTDNFLRTELRGRTVIVDTRFIQFPLDRGWNRYALVPEIYFEDADPVDDGKAFQTMRKLPSPIRPEEVTTTHWLLVGMLIDGASVKDVVRAYDQAAGITPGGEVPTVSVQDFVAAFK